MESPKPLISIITVTYKRDSLLRRSMESLLRAMENEPRFYYEFLVAINGPDKVSKQSTLSFKSRLGSSPLVVRDFDHPKTPALARNELLHEAQGEWVYFIDDDAYVDPDFFSLFRERVFQKDFSILGGPNLTPPGSSSFQKLTGLVLSSRFATFFSSARYGQKGQLRSCEEGELILCNLFVKREALAKDPFAENLVCAEENFLLHQMSAKKKTLYYDPQLPVWHERRENLKLLILQVIKYGRGRGQSVLKDFKILKLPHLLPSLCCLYALFILVNLVMGHTLKGFYFYPFILYILLCLGAAYRVGGPKNLFSKALLFPVIHIAYGGGLLWGVLVDR